MSVKVTEDKLAEVLASIKGLVTKEVLVGIPDSAPERRDETPLSNAQIGYVQENGSPANNIPQRPFLVPGVRDARDDVAESLKGGAKAALAGNQQGTERALGRAGMQAQNAVRRRIQDGPFIPLAPATLAERRRRGRTGDKPLLDTGQLRNSVTFVIRKK